MSYKHINTLREKLSDIELSRALRVLCHLESNLVYFNDVILYAIGNTYKNEETIRNIGINMDVNIIKNESFRIGLRRFLPISMPRIFLMKINNSKDILKVFNELNDHLLIEFGVFHKDMEKNFLNHINSTDILSLFDLIKKDSRYLIYGIDCDNEESSTGIMEFISYGKNTPREVIPLI